ncbi:imidazole glycerol phosphate synthase subunit HisH [Enterovibrio makurazakiensis]|uniref:imidazole glycerol phosphate synthase subunit HisH n=1 Tax=Enterovibrio makurazakiensis TaxID=2910232 RepID=UPI003D2093CA
MIGIIDYGLGNIRAFGNIYKRLGIPHFYAQTPEQLEQATKLILPGVGSFDFAMAKLNDSGMRATLDDLVLNQQMPVIGICVGMQIMANSSEEGEAAGLGWIDATVRKIKVDNHQKYPLPHMGWNTISIEKESSLFLEIEENPQFYFLHSYYFDCADSEKLAVANYSHDFNCIVSKGNIYGIQCHPEKSHHNGVTLLKNFGEVC